MSRPAAVTEQHWTAVASPLMCKISATRPWCFFNRVGFISWRVFRSTLFFPTSGSHAHLARVYTPWDVPVCHDATRLEAGTAVVFVHACMHRSSRVLFFEILSVQVCTLAKFMSATKSLRQSLDWANKTNARRAGTHSKNYISSHVDWLL